MKPPASGYPNGREGQEQGAGRMNLPNDCIALDSMHVLKINASQGTLVGHVVLVNPKQPETGTHLFQLSGQESVEAMQEAAQQGIRALYEG
jgi:hypothetical protein